MADGIEFLFKQFLRDQELKRLKDEESAMGRTSVAPSVMPGYQSPAIAPGGEGDMKRRAIYRQFAQSQQSSLSPGQAGLWRLGVTKESDLPALIGETANVTGASPEAILENVRAANAGQQQYDMTPIQTIDLREDPRIALAEQSQRRREIEAQKDRDLRRELLNQQVSARAAAEESRRKVQETEAKEKSAEKQKKEEIKSQKEKEKAKAKLDDERLQAESYKLAGGDPDLAKEIYKQKKGEALQQKYYGARGSTGTKTEPGVQAPIQQEAAQSQDAEWEVENKKALMPKVAEIFNQKGIKLTPEIQQKIMEMPLEKILEAIRNRTIGA